jgi:hypothetical protein
MQYAINLHSRNSGPLQRGQQNAAQGVTQRQAETAFQRVSNHFANALRIVAVTDFDLYRLNQFLPIFLYQGLYSFYGVNVIRFLAGLWLEVVFTEPPSEKIVMPGQPGITINFIKRGDAYADGNRCAAPA